jgi:hypothetical protein
LRGLNVDAEEEQIKHFLNSGSVVREDAKDFFCSLREDILLHENAIRS